MLPTSAEVEPATSWSPVGRRIQLSHRGRRCMLHYCSRMDYSLIQSLYLHKLGLYLKLWNNVSVDTISRHGVSSYIWHSTDVRAEWPPFSALPGIWIAPFFQQKVYEWPDFSRSVCERPHFSNTLVYAYIFSSEIFTGCLFSQYLMNWLLYLSNHVTTYNKLLLKSKDSIWMDDEVYEWVRFFKGQAYEWGRFQNTGSHTGTTITSKLYPSPPPPHTHTHTPPPRGYNSNLSWGHCEGLVYGGQGLDRRNDITRAAGSGHIFSSVQARVWGQPLNLHSVRSFGFYCL